MMKSGRNQNRYMGLKALFVLLLTMGLLCGVAAVAEQTDPLKPDDKAYSVDGELLENSTNAGIVLHKQAERIGPDEWKVDVSATVQQTEVERPKAEIVFVLDVSSTMNACAVMDQHNQYFSGGGLLHTHTDNCPDDCTATHHVHVAGSPNSVCYKTGGENGTVYYPRRIDVARDAINSLVGNLPAGTAVKYAYFSTNAGVTDNYNNLGQYDIQGQTYIMSGVDLGLQQFSDDNVTKILVLVTDGQATDNLYTSAAFEAFDGMVFTVGFNHVDENLIGMVKNGGNYYMASNPGELVSAFEAIERRISTMMVDPMGPKVDFDLRETEVTTGNLTTSGNTIYWTPNENQELAGKVLEYSYKVKLNDHADRYEGTHSDIPLNNPTIFRYGVTEGEQTQEYELNFPIPQATYAISSVQVKWVNENNQDIKTPTAVESIICDWPVAAFETDYTTIDPIILANGTYYEYVNTTYTANNQDTNDVDPSKPVAYVVTHHYAPAKTAVTVTKSWNDANDQDEIRPESVSVQLMAGTQKVGDAVVLDKNNNWSHTWTGLNKYADNVEIEYTVAEVNVPAGYESAVTGNAADGYVITNTHAPAKTAVTVTKNWNDANNQDGIRPASVSVQLKTGEANVGAAVELNQGNKWAHTWTGLDKYAAGAEIAYTVAEVDVPAGYTAGVTGSVADGFVITNTHVSAKTAVTVTKIWDDANNQDGIRPESVSVQLKAGEANVGTVVELNEGNNWTHTWTGLDKYAAGVEIAYTVAEVNVPAGYTAGVTGSVANGYVITNTHAPAKTAVTVTKNWNDANNQDGIRPASVSVQLKADGEDMGAAVVLNKNNNWTHTWEQLNQYYNGNVINYTVEEAAVPEGYTVNVTGSAAEGYVITNTHAPAKTAVTVTKSWNDANNQDGKRPASVKVQLKAGTQTLDTVVLNKDNEWKYTWTGLNKYVDGVEIAYTVTEETVPGYKAEITGNAADGYVITNTHEPEKTAVKVEKVWEDEGNQDGTRPASVSVQLKTGEANVGAAVELNQGNNWAHTWTGLDKYAAGVEIAYAVAEVDVPAGYTAGVTGSVADGFVITNTHEPQLGSLKIIKKSQGSSVPDDAEFLISDAEGDVIHSVYFSEFSDGEYVLNSLPAGRYTVQEVVGSAEVDHYTLTVDGNGQEVTVENGATASATITNIYKRNMGALTISKTVEGMESELTFAMTVCFYDEEGEELTDEFAYIGDLEGTLISGESVSLGHEQSITFEEIPTGTQYTVTEAEHEAFTASVRVAEGNEAEGNEAEGNEAEGNEAEGEITLEGSEVEFVNTVHTTDFEVTKIWDGGDGEISLTLYANGKMLDPQPACIRNGNTYTYTDLPVCDREGNWLTYSAKEKYVDGFITMYLNEGEYADDSSMVYDGGRILNRAAMAVSVRKIWKGMGAEEPRPQITLTLYRNGEKMNRKTPEPDAEGWYTFDNLPTSYNGKPAVYTVQEEPVKGFITTYINNGVESTDCAKNGGTIVNYRMPETGDRGDLAFWMAMLAASGAMWALVTAVCRRKRMN